jgi:protein phosphatase
MLRPPEIAAVLRREADPTRCANARVDAANAAGGEDNITAVVVDVVADGDPIPAASAGAGTVGPKDTLVDTPAVAAGGEPPASAAPPEPVTPAPARRTRRERRVDRHVGRTIVRVVWFAVPILLIVGIGVAAVAWYARRTYFVAFDDRNAVVLYQGRPGGLLLWDPTVVRRTTLRRAELPEPVQLAIDGEKEFSNRGDAVAYVVRFEQRAKAEAATTTTTAVPTTTTSTAPGSAPAPTVTP